MRTPVIASMVTAAFLAFAGPAVAAPCFLIIDKNDVVVYRDLTPPFDIGPTQSPERAQLRQRGSLLLMAEFEQCNPVGYISPTTGATTATVDEIVMQLKPAVATSLSGSGNSTVRAVTQPGSSVRPVGIPSGRAATTPSRSTGSSTPAPRR